MTRPASPRVRAGAVVLVVAGAFAEVHGGNDVILLAVLDWLVGAAFAAAAVWTGAERWVALLAAGTWYLGAVAGTAGWLGTIGTAAVLAYRAPVLHLLLRPGRGQVLAVAAYPTVLLSSRIANPITIALALACAATIAGTLRRLPSDRRSNAAARAVLALLLAAVWADSTTGWPPEPRLVALNVIMIATSVVTASLRRTTLAAATDLLVDLDPARRAPAPVSTVIGRTLGAAELSVRYRPPEGEWLDELALPAPPPPAGTLTAPTPDRGLVALVDCPPELVDSELGRAAARGAALDVADTMALAAVRQRAAEVDTSRRRLLEVSDSERRELVERVRAGPVAQPAQVRRLLDHITGVDAAEVDALRAGVPSHHRPARHRRCTRAPRRRRWPRRCEHAARRGFRGPRRPRRPSRRCAATDQPSRRPDRGPGRDPAALTSSQRTGDTALVSSLDPTRPHADP